MKLLGIQQDKMFSVNIEELDGSNSNMEAIKESLLSYLDVTSDIKAKTLIKLFDNTYLGATDIDGPKIFWFSLLEKVNIKSRFVISAIKKDGIWESRLTYPEHNNSEDFDNDDSLFPATVKLEIPNHVFILVGKLNVAATSGGLYLFAYDIEERQLKRFPIANTYNTGEDEGKLCMGAAPTIWSSDGIEEMIKNIKDVHYVLESSQWNMDLRRDESSYFEWSIEEPHKTIKSKTVPVNTNSKMVKLAKSIFEELGL